MNQHLLTLYALICDNALYELKRITHRTTKGCAIIATRNGHPIENVISANVKRGYVFCVIRNERDNTSKFKILRGAVRIFVMSEGKKENTQHD